MCYDSFRRNLFYTNFKNKNSNDYKDIDFFTVVRPWNFYFIHYEKFDTSFKSNFNLFSINARRQCAKFYKQNIVYLLFLVCCGQRNTQTPMRERERKKKMCLPNFGISASLHHIYFMACVSFFFLRRFQIHWIQPPHLHNISWICILNLFHINFAISFQPLPFLLFRNTGRTHTFIYRHSTAHTKFIR